MRGLGLLRGLAMIMILAVLLAVPIAPAQAGDPLTPGGQAYPGWTVAPGNPALFFYPSPTIHALIEVSGFYADEAGNVYPLSTSGAVRLEGVPWPYKPGLYAFLLPAYPGGQYWVGGGVLVVNVTVSLYYNGSLVGTVEWAPGGAEARSFAFLAAEGWDEWTLGLSPAGWSWPENTPLEVRFYAFGFPPDHQASLIYRVGGGDQYISAARPDPAWSGAGELVRVYNDAVSRLPLPVEPPTAWTGGAGYTAVIQGLPAGVGVEFWARIVWDGGTYTSPRGQVWIDSPDGPGILVVDDDMLLYTAASSTEAYWTAQSLGDPAGRLHETIITGKALAAADLITAHDWSPLARKADIYIAYPGDPRLPDLAGNASLVWISGLPPAIPGTIADWASPGGVQALVEALGRSETPIVATYTAVASIADCQGTLNLYPGLAGGDDSLAALLGLHLVSLGSQATGCPPLLAPRGVGDPLLAPAPGAPGPGLPQAIDAGGAPTLAGLQAILAEGAAPSPYGAPETLSTTLWPWQALAAGPLRDAANWSHVQALVEGLPHASQQLRGELLSLSGTLDLGLASLVSRHAVPVMLSADGSYAVYALDDGTRRAVYASFEPEALPPSNAAPLTTWILTYALQEPQAGAEWEGVAIPRQAQTILEGKRGVEAFALLLSPDDVYTVSVPEGAYTLLAASRTGLPMIWPWANEAGRGWALARVQGPTTVSVTVDSRLALSSLLVAYWPQPETATPTPTTTSPAPATTTTTATPPQSTTTTTTSTGRAGADLTPLLYALLATSLIALAGALIYLRRKSEYSYY